MTQDDAPAPLPEGSVVGLLVLLTGGAGALLGYATFVDSRWGAACVGFLITATYGLSLLALVAPATFLDYFRRTGTGDFDARLSPLSTILTSAGVYFLFRSYLTATLLWSAIVAGGALVGLAALTRLMNAIVEDD